MAEFWDEIADMEQRMDDMIRHLLGKRAHLANPALPLFVRRPFVPVTDTFEKGEDLVVRVELPGIDPNKDVQVFVDDATLVIRGARKQTDEVEDESYYRMEASFGAFERRLPIPRGIDEQAIEAEYVDGVLRVRVPKAAKRVAPPEAKEIPVRTAKAAKAA
jgi:HSP20 family protein